MERIIKGTDENQNEWSIKLVPHEIHKNRKQALLTFNNKTFTLFNFSRKVDAENFWELMKLENKSKVIDQPEEN